MKKSIVLILLAALLVSVFAIGSHAKETELLAKASQWEYLAYEESDTTVLSATAPAGWLAGTDSETWNTGLAPFSKANGRTDANTHFDYDYFSAFLRTKVTVEDPAQITTLSMGVIYDENPTIYFNGTAVWTAEGYKDSTYVAVDLTDAVKYLKKGENVVCVAFSNVYGGAMFDMTLNAISGKPDTVKDGKAVAASATSEGFANFGAVNDPANILDMNQNTVTGSAFNADVEQAVTVHFVGEVSMKSIFVQCKDEGTTTNDDGTRGTYDVYAVNAAGEATKLGSLKAVTGTDGGAELKLDTPVKAAGVKVVITSWQGDCWACVADVEVTAEALNAGDDPVDPPVDPPVAGEYTVWFALIAVAALFGCALAVRSFRKEH